MTTTEPTNRPSHRLFAVRRTGNGNALWEQIGAAWPNEDGKGFNIKLNLLPLNGAEIVMREPRQEENEP